jgi:hypothetical protein
MTAEYSQASTEILSNLDAALEYARRGAMVLPVCWPNDASDCACPGIWDSKAKKMVPHQGKDVGKAPFAKGGYTAATSDLEQIKSIWTKYPLANVGGWLEGSGWAAIDCDSPIASAEAHKLGMLPRPIRHSRHQAYIFKLPPGAPIERVIHAGSDGKLDILSEGHLVLYGRHAEGHRVWVDWNGLTELNPLEQWAVDLLIRRAAEKDASVGPVGEEGKPTPFSDQEVLERARKSERSGELFAALYDHGGLELIGACPCTPTCAPSCPHKPICTGRRCPSKCSVKPYASESERDLALMNILRFFGGADTARMERLFETSAPGKRPKWNSSASYRKATLTKALKGKVWQPGSDRPDLTPLEKIEQSGSDGGETVCISIERYNQLVAAEERLRQVETIIANPGIKPGPKLIGVAAILEMERREDWRPSKLEVMVGIPNDFRFVSRTRLAAAAGKVSEDSVDRGLDTLERLGIFEHRTAGLPSGKPDVVTGEILNRPQRFTALRLLTPAPEALNRLATAIVEPTPKPKPKPGTCGDHPRAGTVLKARKTLHCEVCNDQLAQSPQIAVTDEKATLSSIPPVVIGTPQIAATGAVSRQERQATLLGDDIRRDNENAAAIADGLAKLYERGNGRAAPLPDEERVWWARQASTNWAELDQGHRPPAVAGGSE